MTKIKNTKKGMAKKTLSMSLVVAMLATSNVPVWAAEFSDGSDVAVTSEAAAPVAEDTEAFSDETVDAPVVDDAAEEVSTAQVAEGYTVNTNMELKSVDWASNLKLSKKEGVKDDAKFEILDKMVEFVIATRKDFLIKDSFKALKKLEINANISSSFIRQSLDFSAVSPKIADEVKGIYVKQN